MAGSNHPGNPVNAVSAKTVHTKSRFPLAWMFANTERFGFVNLTMARDVVRGDNLSLRSPHELRSYTLKTPFFGAVRKNKDYFFVGKHAILPINADKVITQPTIGDDVPYGANCAISNAPYKFGQFVKALVDAGIAQPSDQDEERAFQKNMILAFVVGSYFFSSGSLLAQSGYNLARQMYFYEDSQGKTYYWDDLYDQFFDALSNPSGTAFSYKFGDSDRVFTAGDPDFRKNLLRHLEILHDEPSMIERLLVLDYSAAVSDLLTSWRLTVPGNVANFQWPSDTPDDPSANLNFGKLAAYQIACHHYYSNDKIDYIYSAQLYRDLMGSYVKELIQEDGDSSLLDFSYNGIGCQYDWLSGFVLDIMLSFAPDYDFVLSYLAGLFSFRRSLRYVDYFVGARTNPLAVGDVNTPVTGDGVNVIDLAQTTARARLLNATNQLGSKMEKWLEGIFPGKDIKWDRHDPAFIGHVVDMVTGQENENTGAPVYEDTGDQATTQVSTTAVFRSRTSRDFAFQYTASLPGYVIGVTYYDIPRVYTHSTSREMMALDRYDEFNPFMQFTGDQPIYQRELINDHFSAGRIFGYQTKDMQYKQAFNYAAGGFSENRLPSWFFDDSSFFEDTEGNDGSIGPDFIRSRSGEIDKFYMSLTGWSLSTYWHFIVVYHNDMKAVRPMSYIPQLSV